MTLLDNGRVLIAGGSSASGVVTAAEIYNPPTGLWTASAAPAIARYAHTATLLTSGRVLVAGGRNTVGVGYLSSAEVYDPVADTWSATGPLATLRANHTATLLANGRVLVTAGGDNTTTNSTSELYDPATGLWSLTGSLKTARVSHSASLLPSGQVLLVGGYNTTGTVIGAMEVYDPGAGTFADAGSLLAARALHSATLLPGGRVIFAGGVNAGGPITGTEIADPAAPTWKATQNNVSTGRYFAQTMPITLLPNGKALAVGGYNYGSSTMNATAELYDPVANSWSATGALITVARSDFPATLLPSGKVLIAGGYNSSFDSVTNADLYDPVTATWAMTGPLTTSRRYHSATLLADGTVLVAGGQAHNTTIVGQAELYDPDTGLWTPAGTLVTPRRVHGAVLLPDGRVLICGGLGTDGNASAAFSSAELYNPVTRTWSSTGSLNYIRSGHTLTLMTNGKVLATSADNGQAEIFDPATGTWSLTPAMTGRRYATATVLPDGRVMVAGGSASAVVEIYDPATGTWKGAPSLATARTNHGATVLANGKVLIAGGFSAEVTSEVYDPGLGAPASSQPAISSASFAIGPKLAVAGSRFRGISGASGGNANDSSTNYPILEWRRYDNQQVVFLPADPGANFSASGFTSSVFANMPRGHALLTVWANGIPSDAYFVSAVTVTVSFNSNGGSPVTSQSILVGTPAVLPTPPARPGYAFAGWISDLTLVNYNFSTPVGANFALYAAWTALDNLSYNGNGSTGGAVPAGTTAYAPGATVTVLGNSGSLVRPGFTFAGWNAAANGAGAGYAAGSTFPMGIVDVTLYAQWTPTVAGSTYGVSYSGNGSTGGTAPVDANAYASGATVTVMGNTGVLVKSGFTFAGWDAAVNGSGAGYAAGDTFAMGASNVALYAQWTPVAASYAVTYNGNANTGGTAPVDPTTYAPGATVIAKANSGSLVKTGFSFAGWNAAANGSGAAYPVGATFAMGVPGIILYAQWSSGIVGGCSLDVDGNGQIDPLTDGLVLMRAMFGLTGTAVTTGAIGGGTPTRSTWAVIQPYLNTNCGGNFAP